MCVYAITCAIRSSISQTIRCAISQSIECAIMLSDVLSDDPSISLADALSVYQMCYQSDYQSVLMHVWVLAYTYTSLRVCVHACVRLENLGKYASLIAHRDTPKNSLRVRACLCARACVRLCVRAVKTFATTFRGSMQSISYSFSSAYLLVLRCLRSPLRNTRNWITRIRVFVSPCFACPGLAPRFPSSHALIVGFYQG